MKQIKLAKGRQVPRSNLLHSGLLQSCVSPLEMRAEWVRDRGWTVCHADDGHLEGFAAVALVRRCLMSGSEELQIIRTDDVMRNEDPAIRVWAVPADVVAVSNALAGYGPRHSLGMTRETALLGFQSLLVTDSIEFPSFLLLRDFATCATIAGPRELVCRFVAQASVDYDFYVGIPKDGFSYGDDRQRFDPGMSRSEALRRDREDLRVIRESRSPSQ